MTTPNYQQWFSLDEASAKRLKQLGHKWVQLSDGNYNIYGTWLAEILEQSPVVESIEITDRKAKVVFKRGVSRLKRLYKEVVVDKDEVTKRIYQFEYIPLFDSLVLSSHTRDKRDNYNWGGDGSVVITHAIFGDYVEFMGKVNEIRSKIQQ
jgi:hypothetical protein